ncbi:hypothetical protein [Mucilaginibacter sp. OK098]|uniref:hypothetical protein n=1 Tax=Mucilaginibacter sp. OK098 TaxID=1855297 RepID=UPI0009210570|nr:hypothetical protein [Mucilaginibacter sp. OK098]SHL96368.1 hypothetical protein SAMN05216524_101339 [Mucilaginibacter sp. OK098]
MLNFFYRIFLTVNATALIVVVYLIKTSAVINSLHPLLKELPHVISYVLYITLPIILTAISLAIVDNLDDDELLSVKTAEPANDSFLPSYLGYFFVALSVPDNTTLMFVYLIIFVMTFLSQTAYFNPIFLLFGYKFYYITTQNAIRNFIISKRTISSPISLDCPHLKRINDFTFISKN